ncbi:MAG: YIP1 family protein [Pseudomonadales bacterium]|uniref:Membrane protein n=1 Tax=Oleiphilus messinensis TaxID=141451 RepID=A0A1Y0I3V8_9GAMM|nr:Yip1 family protein [Oleiphilus messinensis]ARU55101.1 membrane protein [Oleiphilus messinensis]MCG8608919.1 YIP1 family protein [Pseudomonadales bacterium]
MSIGHVLGLLTHPDLEWESIRRDGESVGRLYASHVLALALIPAAAGYYGATQVGWSIAGGDVVKLTSSSAIQLCTLFYCAMIVGLYIIGKFIDFFAATFDVDDTQPKGFILAAYTATPLFVMGIIAVYPVLWVNMLAGIIAVAYSVYLLYEGLPILMKIPAEKGFIFASSVLTVGLVMLVGLLAITVIIWSVGIGPVYIR